MLKLIRGGYWDNQWLQDATERCLANGDLEDCADEGWQRDGEPCDCGDYHAMEDADKNKAEGAAG